MLKKSSVSIHVRNLQVLATEMYKVSNELLKPIMKDITPINKNTHTLRHNSQFSRCLLKTLYDGTKSISNYGPNMGDLVSNSLKEIDSLEVFKQAIKK